MLHRSIVLAFLTLVASLHSASGVIFMVTTNGNSGPGSLRQAVLDANATPGPDAIHFNIGTGFGPKVIAQADPLPTVTDAVEINGRTQPGYTNSPRIFLFGNSVGYSAPVLRLECSGAAVLGISITGFPYDPAILINGGGGHLIAGNWIGTFTQELGNANGIVVSNSHGNQIGLSHALGTNTIINNRGYGILFAGSSSNVVEANIMADNILDGIALQNNSTYNSIGGMSPGAGNLISGNQGNGISMSGSPLNVIEGNYIGSDDIGTSARPNALCGINVFNSPDTTIGGTTGAARNVISGNGVHGIEIAGGSSINNIVQGNYIGVAASGAVSLPNSVSGAFLNNTTDNLIGGTERGAGNVISGNGDYGIWMFNASNNIVQGNLIGTDHTGSYSVKNVEHGMLLTESPDNLIGGFEAGARNIISGNNSQGMRLTGNNSRNNIIAGNYAGTDISGGAALPNGSGGVQLNGAPENSVQGNLLSGNLGPGLDLLSSNSVVIANLIGTDASGGARLPNQGGGIRVFSRANTIGGTDAESRNIISGNEGAGIQVAGTTAVGNVIQGNYIGLNRVGTAAVANSFCGVQLTGAATATTVGGSEPGAANIISGNGGVEALLSAGIIITGVGTTNNVVHGNRIGTDASGQFGIPNRQAGVGISGANRNHIGGTTPGEGNVIAFNGEAGVVVEFAGTGNAILGNSIHSNARLGIDLGADGVTPNDVGDGDTGPNALQNYPVITNVVYLSNNTIIQGYLRSSTDGSFSIDVYANVATEQSGYGEGQFYLGNVDVDTDESGFTQFAFSAGNAFSNQFFTATALNYDTGDTSEFSMGIGGIRITAVQRAGSQYHVSFSTRTNHTYVPEFTTNLNSSTAWSPVVVPPQPIEGTGGIITVSDVTVGGDRMRIYRVREQP